MANETLILGPTQICLGCFGTQRPPGRLLAKVLLKILPDASLSTGVSRVMLGLVAVLRA